MSIMDQGKDTLFSFATQTANSGVTWPRSSHCSTTAMTPARSFSPLWEQLSMLTTAMGAPPARKRSHNRAVVMLMAWEQPSGPFSKSAWTKGKYSP